jgi:hypothetical protein
MFCNNFCNDCQVILAREYLKEVNISSDQVKYLVEEARRGGVQVRLNLTSNSQSNNLMTCDEKNDWKLVQAVVVACCLTVGRGLQAAGL